MSKNRLSRKGNVSVLACCMMPVLIFGAAYAIDLGRINRMQGQLQAAADGAALAAAEELPDESAAVAAAKDIAGFNVADHGDVVTNQEVEFGIWDEDSKSFTSSPGSQANAVKVTVSLSTEKGNPFSLVFGGAIGRGSADLSAYAIAIYQTEEEIGTRFLIDEEMFDKDVRSIEDLADDLNRDAEELVTSRGFNRGKKYGKNGWLWEDNFLDIPAGSQLTLPTGQGENYDNNDAGMFDIGGSDFEFGGDAERFKQFIMYSETGGDRTKWGTDTSWIKNRIDPLDGVTPVTNPNDYQSFVNHNFIHVSPIFESDISTLNKSGGKGRVNAKGLRRGLLAFKIVGVGKDIDGKGSVLPELIIEVVDPNRVSLDDLPPSSQSSGSSGVTHRIVK